MSLHADLSALVSPATCWADALSPQWRCSKKTSLIKPLICYKWSPSCISHLSVTSWPLSPLVNFSYALNSVITRIPSGFVFSPFITCCSIISLRACWTADMLLSHYCCVSSSVTCWLSSLYWWWLSKSHIVSLYIHHLALYLFWFPDNPLNGGILKACYSLMRILLSFLITPILLLFTHTITSHWFHH